MNMKYKKSFGNTLMKSIFFYNEFKISVMNEKLYLL